MLENFAFIPTAEQIQTSNLYKFMKKHSISTLSELSDRPKKIFMISDLPKTRTGKIMRRLLKAKLLGLPLGDLSSLENPQVLDEIPNRI